MNELIKIEEVEGIDTVNAKELHAFLEVGKDFSSWIKGRISKYEFIHESDFIEWKSAPQNGGPAIPEYSLSLDMAKELSMLERNEKGREARKYFISMEKKAIENQKAISPVELILKQAQALVDQERRINEQDKRLVEQSARMDVIEAKQITSGNDFFTVSGYCSLKGVKAELSKASLYGRKCAKLSRELDYPIDKIKDPRYGQVNSYHVDVLQEVIG